MASKRDKVFIISFGDRIRQLRTKQEWSQYDLAGACDIERSQIARIERGEISTSISTARNISEALGISLSELFDF